MYKNHIAKEIVDFWYTIELLTQEKFPKQDTFNRRITNKVREYSINVHNTDPKGVAANAFTIFSPLKSSTEINSIIEKGDRSYKFHPEKSGIGHICYGKVQREELVQKLYQVLGVEDKRQEKETDEIALFSFKRNLEGALELNSLQISPLIWGINQCMKNPFAIDKSITKSAYDHEIEILVKKMPDDLSVNSDFIQFLFDTIHERFVLPLKLGTPVKNEGLFVYSRYNNEKTKHKEDGLQTDVSQLSRSFYSEDLSMISRHFDMSLPLSGMRLEVFDYITDRYQQSVGSYKRTHKHIDIRSNKKELESILDVSNISLSKWPSMFKPALMQQVAINYMTKEDSTQHIFSVNGPPGTGKTTLLKEIIAHNIVERAQKLSEYTQSDDAFDAFRFVGQDGNEVQYDKFIRKYHGFKDSSINEYSMLVASNNNAAVENITVELPGSKSLLKGLRKPSSNQSENAKALNDIANMFDINTCKDSLMFKEYKTNPDFGKEENEKAKKWFEDSHKDVYFSWLAHKLQGGNNEVEMSEVETWGLISAPLGKRSNLKKYYYNVIKHFVDYAMKLPSDCKSFEDAYSKSRRAFISQYKKVESLKETLIKDLEKEDVFEKNKAKLNRALDRLGNQEILIRQKINKLEDTRNNLEGNKFQLEGRLDNEQSDKLKTEDALSLLSVDIKNCEEKKRIISDLIEGLKKEVGIIDKVLYKFLNKESEKHVEIKSQQLRLTDVCNALIKFKEKCTESEKNLLQTGMKIRNIEREFEGLVSQLVDVNDKIILQNEKVSEIKVEVVEINNQIAKGLKDLSKHLTMMADTRAILDDSFWLNLSSEEKKASTDAQLTNPWVTEAFNREREKLFYASLQLHKYFILSSQACRRNLYFLGMMWGYKENNEGNVPNFSSQHKNEAYDKLLSTLFLLTPVISTTFASVGRFLNNARGEDSIGVLIVDEAGQAPPQIAAGALWRSKRAIIVGDPKQVEPVVTSDSEIIMKAFSNEVLSNYLDKSASVQSYADSINPIGSIIKDKLSPEDNGEWVGCPLVVHRRCIEPMYGLSNKLSYGDTMKYQTAEPPEKDTQLHVLENSCWIDVQGSEVGQKNHFVKNQGDVIRKLVQKSFEKYKLMETDPSKQKPKLYIISPFTTVVKGIKAHLKADKTLKSFPCFEEWLNDSVGTVHKFQGKEAHEVLLALGCDKKAMGAVKWVNKNILNVAATRAQYKFYIVGDLNVWTESSIFKLASEFLERKEMDVCVKESGSQLLEDNNNVS